MIELIGFWSGVTILAYFLLFLPVCLLIAAGEGVIEWASRGRVKCGDVVVQWLQDKTSEDFTGVSFCVSFISIVIFTFIKFLNWVCDDETVTYVEMVSDLSQWAAPVFGYIATVGIVVGSAALILRKMFDMFFGIKDKIDSLENKDV